MRAVVAVHVVKVVAVIAAMISRCVVLRAEVVVAAVVVVI